MTDDPEENLLELMDNMIERAQAFLAANQEKWVFLLSDKAFRIAERALAKKLGVESVEVTSYRGIRVEERPLHIHHVILTYEPAMHSWLPELSN